MSQWNSAWLHNVVVKGAGLVINRSRVKLSPLEMYSPQMSKVSFSRPSQTHPTK